MEQILREDATPNESVPRSQLRRGFARGLRAVSTITPILLLTAAHRPAADERAVLASVHALFDALAERNVPAMLAHVVPGGTGTDIVRGKDGTVRFKAQPYVDFLRATPAQGPRLEEMLRHPEVRIDYDMATVWGEYTFREDGRISNCGMDSIQLIRVGGEWKILNFSWTSRSGGCGS